MTKHNPLTCKNGDHDTCLDAQLEAMPAEWVRVGYSCQRYPDLPVSLLGDGTLPKPYTHGHGVGAKDDTMAICSSPFVKEDGAKHDCQHSHLDGMEYKDGHKREECFQCSKVWSTRNGDQLLNGQHAQVDCPDLQAMNPGPGPWMKPWPCPRCIKDFPTQGVGGGPGMEDLEPPRPVTQGKDAQERAWPA